MFSFYYCQILALSSCWFHKTSCEAFLFSLWKCLYKVGIISSMLDKIYQWHHPLYSKLPCQVWLAVKRIAGFSCFSKVLSTVNILVPQVMPWDSAEVPEMETVTAPCLPIKNISLYMFANFASVHPQFLMPLKNMIFLKCYSSDDGLLWP